MKIAEFLRNRSGNFAVYFGIAALPLLAAAGAAMTMVMAEREKTILQDTLDSAVLAAAALPYNKTDEQRLAAAYDMTAFANQRGADPDVNTQVHVESMKFEVTGTTVTGTSDYEMQNLFGGVVGSKTISLKVAAKAQKRESSPLCFLSLNKHERRSLEIYGNASFEAKNCSAMVNSDSGEGIKQYGAKSEAKALSFAVTGAFSGKNIEPAPLTDIEPVADPYADLPFPAVGPCIDGAEKLSKAVVTLLPGTYCGGINISPQSNVTLLPGIYVMKDGPLRIGANSKLHGEEALIAFAGYNSVLESGSGSEIVLTSPKSGDYMNMQFMSDGVLNGSWKGEEWVTISASTLSYDGVMYLPEQDIWIKGSSQVVANSPTLSMIGDQFWIQDASSVSITQDNERGLDIEGAGHGYKYSAILVQ